MAVFTVCSFLQNHSRNFIFAEQLFLLRPICSEYSFLHDLATVLDHLFLLTVRLVHLVDFLKH